MQPRGASGLPEFLTVPEVQKTLRLGRSTVYKFTKLGILPTIRIGRRLLVRRDELEALIAKGGRGL